MATPVYSVFDTSYVSSHQETLRWASVAIAGFMTLLIIIWGIITFSSRRFRDEMATSRPGWFLPAMLSAVLYFAVTVAATFLSWYVAALHIGKNNLIALDVVNFVAILFLGFAVFFRYQSSPNVAASQGSLHIAIMAELIAIIILLASPQAAGSAGILVQTTLYIPLLVSTFGAMVAMKNNRTYTSLGAPTPIIGGGNL